MFTKPSLFATAVLAAALLPASAAHAELYCVNTASCSGGTTLPDVQAAIDAAETDGGGADTVRIGPKLGAYVGPFTYSAGGNGGKLTIEGAGVGATILGAGAASGHTLSLDHPDSVVKNLTLRTPSSGQFSALWLAGGSAEGIKVEQAGSDFSTRGVALYGDGSAVADSTIAMTAGTGVVTANPNGATGLRVDRSVLTGRAGADASFGSSLTVDRAIVDTARTALTATSNQASLTVTNSIVRLGNQVAGDSAIAALGTGSVTAAHVTVLGPGTGSGVQALSASPGWQASVNVRNSIISGFPRHTACAGENGGTASVILQYTAVNGSGPAADPDCTFTSGAGVQSGVTPQFVGGVPGSDLAAADLRLKAPSPLIDAGDTSGILTTDFAGLSRPVDGNGLAGATVDLGALEYRREAPVPALSAPAGGQVGEQLAFSAAGSSDPDGDALTYQWAFGDGIVASGVQAAHAFTAPGEHTVKLTVLDAAGRSATATATLQIEAPPVEPGQGDGGSGSPAPQPPASGEGSSGAGAPSGNGSAATPSAAPQASTPTLGRLRAAARAKLRTRGSLLTGKGAALRTTASGPGTLQLTLKRGKAKPVQLRFKVARAGGVAVALGRRSGLRPGRYTVTAVLLDASGARSKPQRVVLKLR